MASNTCSDRIKFSHFKEVEDSTVLNNHNGVTEADEHYNLDNLYLVGYTTNGGSSPSQYENVQIQLNNIKKWIFDQRRFLVTDIDPTTSPDEFCELDPNYIYLFKRDDGDTNDSIYEEWIIVEGDGDNVAGGNNRSPERLGSVSVYLKDYAKKGVYRLDNLTYYDSDQQKLVNAIVVGGNSDKVISIDSIQVKLDKVVNVENIWKEPDNYESSTTLIGVHDVYYEETNDETSVYFYGNGASLDDVKAKNTWYENDKQYMQYISEIVITYSYVTLTQFEELIEKEVTKH